MSCQTSGCRCSSEHLLRAASGQPHGSDTSHLTRGASGHPNKLWRYFSGWHGLTPCSSYLRTNKSNKISFFHDTFSLNYSSFLISAHAIKDFAFTLLTLNQVVIGFSPGVAMLWCKDANRLLVSLQRWVPDLLQLHVQLVYCQPAAIAVVHIQDKELQGEARPGWFSHSSSMSLAIKPVVINTRHRPAAAPSRVPGSYGRQWCEWEVFSRWRDLQPCLSLDQGGDRRTGSGNIGPYTAAFHSDTQPAGSHYNTVSISHFSTNCSSCW